MDKVKEYFAVLELPNSATILDVKKAFREKAKLYHPDISTLADAEEKFIKISEAYEYLVDHLTGKNLVTLNTSKTNYQSSSSYTQKSNNGQHSYARMKYDEFIKTDYYKFSIAYHMVMQLTATFVSIGIILSLVIGLTIYAGIGGFIVGAILSAPLWLVMYFAKLSINQNLVREAFKIIRNSPYTYKGLLVSLNISLFIYFGLKTLFNPWVLILTYVLLAAALIWYFKNYPREHINRKIVLIGIVPFCINLFLVVNFLSSGPSYSEKYTFKYNYERYTYTPRYSFSAQTNYENTGFITLENGMYYSQFWIRHFFDFKDVVGESITYYFADGLLGLKVLKRTCFNDCLPLKKQ